MSSPRANPVILVVDDQGEVAALLSEFLTAAGYTVTTAGNGREALQRLQEGPVDLIISDVVMPGLDGPGLYREVARLYPQLQHRYIWMSGEVPVGDMREFLLRTERPQLLKPFVLDAVRQTVRQVLETP